MTHLKNVNWYRTGSIDYKFTFLMNATENVSHDTIPWSISSTNAVSVKDNISPKLQETGVMITFTSDAAGQRPRE